MSQIFRVQEGDYIQMPWGTLVFRNNELHLTTNVNDPSGISGIGANGMKYSWKKDSGEEWVLQQLRQNQNGDGEFYFGTVDAARYQQTHDLDHSMIEIATFNPRLIEFRAPVKFSAGFIGGTSGTSDTIWSPSGVWFTQMQDDGNLVKYQTGQPFVKGPIITATLIG